MFGVIVAAAAAIHRLPDPVAHPPTTVPLLVNPVTLARPEAPLRLVGAWRLGARDPRFGGISGLVADRGVLLALTDSGAVARLDLGRGQVTMRDLPSVPGDPARKRGRDSESLVRDPAGRGWWVAFEQQHRALLFDPGISRRIGSVRFESNGWGANRGVEAMAVVGLSLLAVTEAGEAFRFGPGGYRPLASRLPPGIADAVALDDGRILLLQRRVSWRGFGSQLLVARQRNGVLRVVARYSLHHAPLDNLEAVAAAPLVNGGTRLWIMSDDNFRPWMRTLLIALDLPAERTPD